jgi:hypothetical protein
VLVLCHTSTTSGSGAAGCSSLATPTSALAFSVSNDELPDVGSTRAAEVFSFAIEVVYEV